MDDTPLLLTPIDNELLQSIVVELIARRTRFLISQIMLYIGLKLLKLLLHFNLVVSLSESQNLFAKPISNKLTHFFSFFVLMRSLILLGQAADTLDRLLLSFSPLLEFLRFLRRPRRRGSIHRFIIVFLLAFYNPSVLSSLPRI